MRCNVISTGSIGNAVLLNGKYLFDCGVPLGKLGNHANNLRIVFLTHIHGDHFRPRTIHRLHKLHPMIRFVCGRHLLVPLCTEAGVSPSQITVVDPGKITEINYGSEVLRIQPFELIHNVENYGYVVEIVGGSDPGRAMYATDTQYIPIAAPGLDLYMVEANYKTEELMQRRAAKLAAGDFAYEDRVLSCHMSEEWVKAWLAQNQRPDSQVVFLHQHIERKHENG